MSAHPYYLAAAGRRARQNNDPFFPFVGLLAHGNGADGSQVFTDSSSHGHAPTYGVNGPLLSNVDPKWGSASILQDAGSNSFLYYGPHASLGAGNKAFALEAWFRFNDPAALGQSFIAGLGKAGDTSATLYAYFDHSSMSIKVQAAGQLIDSLGSVGLTYGQWYFMSIQRGPPVAGISSVFLNIDSFSCGSVAGPPDDLGASGKVWVSCTDDTGTGRMRDGNLDDVRLTIGYNRPTAVPGGPFPDL